MLHYGFLQKMYVDAVTFGDIIICCHLKWYFITYYHFNSAIWEFIKSFLLNGTPTGFKRVTYRTQELIGLAFNVILIDIRIQY